MMGGDLSLAIALTTIAHVYTWPGGKVINGEKWIWNTYEEWQKNWFPYWTTRNIQMVIHKLKDAGMIRICQPDGHLSRKNYYLVTEAARRLLTESKADDMMPQFEQERDHEEKTSLSHQENFSLSNEEKTSASITESTSKNTPILNPLTPLQGESRKKEKSQLQLRAEALMRRRKETPLTSAESRAFQKNRAAIEATTEEDWKLLEQFYAAPQEKTYARKDLAALLNNWNGEIDRAKGYKHQAPQAGSRTKEESDRIAKALGYEW